MKNKSAVITGASRGLGLALSRKLAADGWNLVIDARGAEALGIVNDELSALTNIISINGSIDDSQHRSEIVQAVRTFGSLDLLINNAGVLGPSPQPSLMEYPLDILENVFRTNVISQLALIQDLKNYFSQMAKIINVSSDAGVEAYAGWGGYGASKAALNHLSLVLAAENPELRIYSVDPGDMNTQMHQEAFPGEDISDRPLPETSVSGFMELIYSNYPGGRYQARNLPVKF